MEIQRTQTTPEGRAEMRSRLYFNERAQLWFRLEPGDVLFNIRDLDHRIPAHSIHTRKTEEGWVVAFSHDLSHPFGTLRRSGKRLDFVPAVPAAGLEND